MRPMPLTFRQADGFIETGDPLKDIWASDTPLLYALHLKQEDPGLEVGNGSKLCKLWHEMIDLGLGTAWLGKWKVFVTSKFLPPVNKLLTSVVDLDHVHSFAMSPSFSF